MSSSCRPRKYHGAFDGFVRAVGVGQLQQRGVHEDREHEGERGHGQGGHELGRRAGGARCAPCRSGWPSRPGSSPAFTTVSSRWVWPPGPVPAGTPPSAGAAVTSPVGRSATATPPPPPLPPPASPPPPLRRRPRPWRPGCARAGGRGCATRPRTWARRRRRAGAASAGAAASAGGAASALAAAALARASSARLRRCSGISVTSSLTSRTKVANRVRGGEGSASDELACDGSASDEPQRGSGEAKRSPRRAIRAAHRCRRPCGPARSGWP